MNSTASRASRDTEAVARALSTDPGTGRAWWFLGTLAVLRNPSGAPRTPTVIELTIPAGGSPPLHVHNSLDDNFLLLDGELVVRCGDRSFSAHPGTYVVLPAGVEHTFRVTSAGPARMLLVHAADDFLGFIEAVGTPTQELRLPPVGTYDLSREALIRMGAEHDLSIIGPPLQESEVRAAGGGTAKVPSREAQNRSP
jgi:quercetin dioxygenase-like cupin family protein